MTILEMTKEERKAMVWMRIIRRLYWLPVGAALAAALCWLLLALAVPRQFVCSSGFAVVYHYEKNPTDMKTLTNSNAKATEIERIGENLDIAQRTLDKLGWNTTADQLLKNISVTRKLYTMFLKVEAKGETPEAARQLLVAYTDEMEPFFIDMLDIEELHELYPPTEPVKDTFQTWIVLLAALGGLLIAFLTVFIFSFANRRTLEQYNIPILGCIDADGVVTPYVGSNLQFFQRQWDFRFDRYRSCLRSQWWMALLGGLLCGLLSLAVEFTVVPSLHVASGSAVVYRRSVEEKIDMERGSANSSISLAQTYGAMASDPILLQMLSEHLPEGLSRPYSTEELSKNITVKSSTDSFEFTYTVKADTEQDAVLLCRRLIDYTGETILGLFGVGQFENLGVYDEAPAKKVLPVDEVFFTAVLIGIAATLLILLLRSAKYTHLKSTHDVEMWYPDIPLLGTVPFVSSKIK